MTAWHKSAKEASVTTERRPPNGARWRRPNGSAQSATSES